MKLNLLCAALLLTSPLLSWGYGGNHGKRNEPLTVIELGPNLQRDLGILEGVIADARPPASPRLQLEVTKLDSEGTTVRFHNLSRSVLKLELFLVQQDGRFQATTSCPIAPGASSFEVWTEDFDALGFGLVLELAEDDPRATVCR
jgi:hypothetical protein